MAIASHLPLTHLYLTTLLHILFMLKHFYQKSLLYLEECHSNKLISQLQLTSDITISLGTAASYLRGE